ncbi:MAG TPA: sensor histidine kinase [Steroidobacteraceae bacterium]|nr:sensor histidine kinase [Steroidobacteraceae bacterium]
MRQMSSSDPASQRRRVWIDATAVAAFTLGSVFVSDRFQISEGFYLFTRRWESIQLDELPFALLVLVCGLTWLAWRRYREARQELVERARVEAALSKAMDENRRLVREYLNALEAERKHLARELHDHLGQYLNAIKLDASASVGAGAPPPVILAAQRIIRSIDHVYGVVRDLIRRLRPVALDELGLAAAIEHCVDQWRALQPSTRVQLHIGEGLDGLAEPLALTLVRVVQEALTNVYKHARASSVQVLLERRCASPPQASAPMPTPTPTPAAGAAADQVCVDIHDDGCGLAEPAMRSAGLGIIGMRERVHLAGGTFSLRSAPGQGVHIDVRLPMLAPA